MKPAGLALVLILASCAPYRPTTNDPIVGIWLPNSKPYSKGIHHPRPGLTDLESEFLELRDNKTYIQVQHRLQNPAEESYTVARGTWARSGTRLILWKTSSETFQLHGRLSTGWPSPGSKEERIEFDIKYFEGDRLELRRAEAHRAFVRGKYPPDMQESYWAM